MAFHQKMKRPGSMLCALFILSVLGPREVAAALRKQRQAPQVAVQPPAVQKLQNRNTALETENANLRAELAAMKGLAPPPAPPNPEMAADVDAVAQANVKAGLPATDQAATMEAQQDAEDAAKATHERMYGPVPAPAPAGKENPCKQNSLRDLVPSGAPVPGPAPNNHLWEAHLRSLEFASNAGGGCGFHDTGDSGFGYAPAPGPSSLPPLPESLMQPSYVRMTPALDRQRLPTSVGTPAAFCPFCRFCCGCSSNGIEDCETNSVDVGLAQAHGAVVYCSTCQRDCSNCAGIHDVNHACPNGNCCDATVPLNKEVDPVE